MPQERSRARTAERVDCGYLAMLIYFIDRFGNFVSAREQIKFGAWIYLGVEEGWGVRGSKRSGLQNDKGHK